jgi:cytochrome c-type biogenesis protein CcmH/NrfG
MAKSLDLLGRQKESSDAFRRALDLAPDDREMLYWYANSLITLDDKTAVAQFQKLIPLEPNEARGYIGLANASFELERYRDAVAAFARAQKLCATCLNDNDRRIYADARRLAR